MLHAIGNLHAFKRPDDVNGGSYFHVRCYTDTVEEYALLSALLHMFVGFKRTWEQKLSFCIDEWSTALDHHWLSRNCIFMHSVQSSLSLLRNTQIFWASRRLVGGT